MKFNAKSNTLKALLIHTGIVAGLFTLLSFTFFYKILPVATNKDNIITVPDVTGMSLERAMEFLKTRGLDYDVIDSAYSPELPAVTVLKQYPKPLARVKVHRKINLQLNAKNPPTIAYPDLDGTSFEAACKILKTQGLKAGSIKYRPDIAHNAVLESHINGAKVQAGQRIPKGSMVDLVIGAGMNESALPAAP